MPCLTSNRQLNLISEWYDNGARKDYKNQGSAIAVVSVFASTSAAFGPTIGGFLIAEWQWPAIFLINLPIILIGFLLAVIVLPSSGKSNVNWARIDWIGILLFTGAVLGLILFLLSLTSATRWWVLVLCFAAAWAFYVFEQKKTDPFIDVASLKLNRHVNIVYLLFMFINFVYYNYFFGLPTLLQQVRGYSEEHTGLIMLALAGFSVLVTPIAGRLIDRHGSKIAVLTGAVLLLIGTGLLLTYSDATTLLWLLPMMSILGISNGFNNIAAQTALYEHVEEKDTGAASGLFQTSRYLGAILSGSFLGMAFHSTLDIAHFRLVVLIGFGVCFLIVILAALLPKQATASSART